MVTSSVALYRAGCVHDPLALASFRPTPDDELMISSRNIAHTSAIAVLVAPHLAGSWTASGRLCIISRPRAVLLSDVG